MLKKEIYLLLINRARGPYWENIARGLSGKERAKRGPYKKRLRAIFSQYGTELVKVNKKFIIWLCLTLLILLEKRVVADWDE